MRDLTVKEVAALRRKPGKHRVSRQCYLQVSNAGAASYDFRYGRNGERWHGLGSYDLVSLAEARDKVLTCRKMVLSGVDPVEYARAQKMQALLAAASTVTFQDCAEAYLRAHDAGWRSDRHRHQWHASLATYVYPMLGKLPVQAIDLGLVLKVLEPIWQAKPETATRVRSRIAKVLGWATVRGNRHGDNPARWGGHLDQLLPARAKLQRPKHFAALPYAEIPEFLERLRWRPGISSRALELTVLTVARTAETLGALWDEIDFGARAWTIPPERIKAGREHRVPLPDRAVELLQALPRELGNPCVFTSSRQDKPLAESAMLCVLREMGVSCTVHGFRASFRTWCAEHTSFPRDLAEAALAHVVETRTGQSYQRGDLFEKRRRLMNAWARYVTTPRAAGDVVQIGRAS